MFLGILFPNLVTGCEGFPITFSQVQYPSQTENCTIPYLEPPNSSHSFRNQVAFEKECLVYIPCTGKQSTSFSKDHSKHLCNAVL